MAAAAPLRAAPTETVAGSRQRVVESREIDLGDRSLIFNRVEPPVLKPQPEPASTPVAAPSQPSAEELQWMRERESKPDVFMFLSCTVYDRAVTEVRWQREDGQYVVWSSIDFNHLRGLLDFETTDARYSVFLGIGNESIG
jgi:hypothetical protein